MCADVDPNSDEIARLVEAIGQETSPEAALSQLLAASRDDNTSEAGALIRLFLQQFVTERDDKPITPVWENLNGESAPTASAEDDAVWRAAADHPSAGNLIVAQVGHTLCTVSPGKVAGPYGERALIALATLHACQEVDEFDQIEFAVRALHLAKLLRSRDAAAPALSSLLRIADDALDADEHAEDQRPGVTLRALAQYRHHRGDDSERQARLERAADVYSNNARIAITIAMLRADSAQSKTEKTALIDPLVRRLVTDSKTQPGYVRQNTLTEAMRLARAYGLKELQGLVSEALSAMTADDYDFQSLRTEIPWPDGYLDARLAAFAPDRTPEQILAALALTMPHFRPLAERPPHPVGLLDLVTQVSVHGAGHVDFAATSEAQRVQMRARHDDSLEFQLESQFIAQGLQALRERVDVSALLRERIHASDLLSYAGKRRAERALDAFLADDWDVVLDSLPTLEAGIRKLSLGLQVNIYAPQGDANKFKTLGGLLDGISDQYTGDVWTIVDYWRFALVDQLGLNIRNQYLHGIVESGSSTTASVVVHVLTQLLMLFKPASSTDAPDDANGEGGTGDTNDDDEGRRRPAAAD